IVSNNSGCSTASEFPINIKVVDSILKLSFATLPDNIISYSLPERSFVKLQLYYMDGRIAATLINDFIDLGEYQYQIDAADLRIPAASYMIRARVDGDLVFNKIMRVN